MTGTLLKGPVGRLAQRYTNYLTTVAATNGHVARVFMEVMHMMRPPGAILHPRIFIAALVHAARARGNGIPATAPPVAP